MRHSHKTIIRSATGRARGGTLFEFIVCLIILSVAAGTAVVFLHRAAMIAKETALSLQLRNLRLSIDLYKAIHDEYPPNLRDLVMTRYSPGGMAEILFGEDFLKHVGRDQEGFPIDPFGKRFVYDREKGGVSSAARGYEQW